MSHSDYLRLDGDDGGNDETKEGNDCAWSQHHRRSQLPHDDRANQLRRLREAIAPTLTRTPASRASLLLPAGQSSQPPDISDLTSIEISQFTEPSQLHRLTINGDSSGVNGGVPNIEDDAYLPFVDRLLAVRNELSSVKVSQSSSADGDADSSSASLSQLSRSKRVSEWSNKSINQVVGRSLQFHFECLEAGYEDDYRARYFHNLRAAVFFCLCIWVLFSITDITKQYVPAPHGGRKNFPLTISIRLIVAALVAAIVCCAYRPAVTRRVTTRMLRFTIAAFIVIFGTCQTVFGVIEENTLDPTYSTFVILIASMAAPFFRLPFLISVLCFALLWGIFAVLTLSFNVYCKDDDYLLASLLWLVVGIGLSSYHAYTVELGMRATFLKAAQLKYEEDQLAAMLARMLPKTAIKKNGNISASHAVWATDYFHDSTILFARIHGFDSLSSTLRAEDVVQLLNELFSEFDKLTAAFGVYKVETISNVYMVSGGVPEAMDNHTSVLALLALAMMEAAVKVKHFLALDFPLELKIGLHQGAVLAGTVGTKYPRYRLIHDTVNVASRMSTTCDPNEIQLSRDAFVALDSRFVCQFRATIPVKGKGEMATYFLRYVLPRERQSPIGPLSIDEALGVQMQEQVAAMLGYREEIETVQKNHTDNSRTRKNRWQQRRAVSEKISPVLQSTSGHHRRISAPPLTLDSLHSDEADSPTLRRVFVRTDSERRTIYEHEPVPDELYSYELPSQRLMTHGTPEVFGLSTLPVHRRHLFTPVENVQPQMTQTDNSTDHDVSNSESDDLDVGPSTPRTTANHVRLINTSMPVLPPTSMTAVVSPSNRNVNSSANNTAIDTNTTHAAPLDSNSSAPNAAVFDENGWRRLAEPASAREWVDLAFRNERVESLFQQHWQQRYKWQSIRGILVFIVGLFGLGGHDTYEMVTNSTEYGETLNDTLRTTWVIRGIAILVGGLVLLWSMRRPESFARYQQPLVSLTWAVMAVLQIAVTSKLQTTVCQWDFKDGRNNMNDHYPTVSIVTVYGVSTTLILIATTSFFAGLQFKYVAFTTLVVLFTYVLLGLLIVPDAMQISFFLLAASVLSMTAAHSTEKFERMDFYRHQRLEMDRQRTKALYDSMLPVEIMREVRAAMSRRVERGLPPPVAHKRDNASVLYCDIVGFTRIAGDVQPTRVVVLLNVMFSVFDNLTTKHRVFKVETIGDAYLACSGVLDKSQPTSDLVRCALDFQTAMRWMPKPRENDPERLQIRAGINTGKVLAGVVGQTMLRYHLFGPTVTIAEEMEQKAETGTVAITQHTYEQIQHEFACHSLTPIQFVQQAGIDEEGGPVEHRTVIERWRALSYTGPPLPHLADEEPTGTVTVTDAEEVTGTSGAATASDLNDSNSSANLADRVKTILSRVRAHSRKTRAELRATTVAAAQ